MIKLQSATNQSMNLGTLSLREVIQFILTLPPIERIAIVKAILQSSDLNLRQFYDDLSSELETAFILSDKQLTQQVMEARNRKATIPLDLVQKKLAQEHNFIWSEAASESAGI